MMDINNEDWKNEMKRECVCGHQLGDHAFTMQGFDEHYTSIRTSICIYDDCKQFREKNR